MENISHVGSFKVHCEQTSSCDVGAQGECYNETWAAMTGHFIRHKRQRNVQYLLGGIVKCDGLPWRCQLAVHAPVGTEADCVATPRGKKSLFNCNLMKDP